VLTTAVEGSEPELRPRPCRHRVGQLSSEPAPHP
jgi:hypothetical protein